MSGPPEDEEALDQAIAWHQALIREDADWEGYIAWLEADPRHRMLFDEVALLDRMIVDRSQDLRTLTSAEAPVASPPGPARHRRVWLAGAGAAAVLAAAFGLPHLLTAPADVTYATGRGETRRLTLGFGKVVELAPSSQLVLRRGDPSAMELARGEAFFSVTHDPSRALNVRAGSFSVTDVGTRFGVNLATDSVIVAVAEGDVAVSAGDGPVTRLSAGQQVVGRAGTLAAVRPVAVRDVGSWRHGRLAYDGAPLRLVAADLSRYSGLAVTVGPSLRERPFTGVLTVGDGSRVFRDLADLMGIAVEQKGDGVRLVPGPVR